MIISEALRVTDGSGKVFVAFYKYHTKVETLLRYTGIITDKNLLRFKKLAEMTMLSFDNPIGFIKAVRNETNVSFLRTLFILMRTQLFLPKKEKRESRKLSALWKRAKNELDNPQSLIDCLPELVPYRNREQISSLFKKFNFSIKNMYFYDSCTIVQL